MKKSILLSTALHLLVLVLIWRLSGSTSPKETGFGDGRSTSKTVVFRILPYAPTSHAGTYRPRVPTPWRPGGHGAGTGSPSRELGSALGSRDELVPLFQYSPQPLFLSSGPPSPPPGGKPTRGSISVLSSILGSGGTGPPKPSGQRLRGRTPGTTSSSFPIPSWIMALEGAYPGPKGQGGITTPGGWGGEEGKGTSLAVGVWTEAWDAVGFGKGGWTPEPVWPTKSSSGSLLNELRRSLYKEWFHMDGRNLLFAAYYSKAMLGWALGRSSLVVFYNMEKDPDTQAKEWYLKAPDAVIYMSSISADISEEGVKWSASRLIPSHGKLLELGPIQINSYKILEGYLVELKIPYRELPSP